MDGLLLPFRSLMRREARRAEQMFCIPGGCYVRFLSGSLLQRHGGSSRRCFFEGMGPAFPLRHSGAGG